MNKHIYSLPVKTNQLTRDETVEHTYFHADTSNTKTLTRVNIRLSKIALNVSREYHKNTLILGWKQIHQLIIISRARVKIHTGDSSLSQPRTFPVLLGNDWHPHPYRQNLHN